MTQIAVISDVYGNMTAYEAVFDDIEREISVARTLGMPELEPYAIELRTSLYRGSQGRPG